MSRSEALYKEWSEDPYFDEATHTELAAIKDQPAEIEERFYKDLEFGTGGLRGIMGAGTNRMNQYTVAKATEGFARYIDGLGETARQRGVAISYDCRLNSESFALITALIFATHGIKAYLYNELHPTPMLSFAVRYYHCAGGVMVTASHNPAQYNGYKAYGEDGGQMPPEAADVVLAEMNTITDFRTLNWISRAEAEQKGLLQIIGPEVETAYFTMLKKLTINLDKVQAHADMKIIYTPLHGTGNKPVRRILKEIGFNRVIVVPEQEKPDGHFPTVKSPNPEERSALQMAIDLAEKENADLVIATDPDGDRTGLVTRLKDGSYQVMTGNQIGLLLMEYILSAKKKAGKLPPRSFCVTTIVSTKLTRLIAKNYDVSLYETLTGFKFIGEKIKDLDENGDQHFQFGFEESYGYLAGTDVRDKDAVVASMLLAEMAATAKAEGKTLADYMEDIYAKYGYGTEKTVSLYREGKEGSRRIRQAMDWLRGSKKQGLPGLNVREVKDYLTGEAIDLQSGVSQAIDLSRSNVLLYETDGLDWACVRPSGTEPKIKIYFGCYGRDREAVKERIEQISTAVCAEIEKELDRD